MVYYYYHHFLCFLFVVDIVPGTPPSEDHLGSLRNQLNKWVKKILQTVNSTE